MPSHNPVFLPACSRQPIKKSTNSNKIITVTKIASDDYDDGGGSNDDGGGSNDDGGGSNDDDYDDGGGSNDDDNSSSKKNWS